MKRRLAYLSPLPGLLALGVAAPALATPSIPFPTYTVGPQSDGSYVMSPNQTITPAGTLVALGSPVRGKAIAINPNPASHTAAVLTMSGPGAVEVFDLVSGQVVQTYSPFNNPYGSYKGLTYSADGSKLYISQDYSNNPYPYYSDLAIANVDPNSGLLTDFNTVALPATTALKLYSPGVAYPGGIAISPDNTTGFVTLNQNNTLGVIDLTLAAPVLKGQIATGNVPHDVIAAPNGLVYVSNEGGRPVKPGDHFDFSSGTEIVSDPSLDFATSGTVSVIDPVKGKVIKTVVVGTHPAGMIYWNGFVVVANSGGESVSFINTTTNTVTDTIKVRVPLASASAYGSNPAGLAIVGSTLYVSLYTANAIAVIDIVSGTVQGYIPTAANPTNLQYDAGRNQLVVACDIGLGAQGSLATLYGVTGFNSHQGTSVVNLVPLPSPSQLANYTTQVQQNNHWDLTVNTQVGPKYVNPNAPPRAIPEHIGEPSLIKKVFLIIKENRTYDQVYGALPGGNGAPGLAVFNGYWPNQVALMNRFAFLDNDYAPSRQSADGHPWIVTGESSYSNGILSPNWIRSYPGGNSNDVLTYTPRGFLWDQALKAGHTARLYGEWSNHYTVPSKYTWSDWYYYSQILEGKVHGHSPIKPTDDTEFPGNIPNLQTLLDPHFPSFNLGIPDQYRVDYWLPIFQNQVSTNTVPDLTVMWIMCDHTSGGASGFPIPTAQQADNDLAVGRIVEAVSNSAIWGQSAIFVEEDDSQNGVDHIDGHRQPVEVISPYVVPSNGQADHTMYTQASMDRTIEQILGLAPMTQFDLVASPMRTVFTDTPVNIAPFTHLPPTIALDTLPGQGGAKHNPAQHASLEHAWREAADALVKQGRFAKADLIDANWLNHATWYAATGYTRPYPGEKDVLPPSAFTSEKPKGDLDD